MKFCHLKGNMGYLLFRLSDGSVTMLKNFMKKCRRCYCIGQAFANARTFAPVVAGIVKMDKKNFLRCNILGSTAWVFTVLMAGYYLEKLFLNNFGFDLKQHLFVIVVDYKDRPRSL